MFWPSWDPKVDSKQVLDILKDLKSIVLMEELKEDLQCRNMSDNRWIMGKEEREKETHWASETAFVQEQLENPEKRLKSSSCNVSTGLDNVKDQDKEKIHDVLLVSRLVPNVKIKSWRVK